MKTTTTGTPKQKNNSIRNNKQPQRNQFRNKVEFNEALKTWEAKQK